MAKLGSDLDLFEVLEANDSLLDATSIAEKARVEPVLLSD